MKIVILTIMGLGFLALIMMIATVLIYERRHRTVTCFIIGCNASIHTGPGWGFHEVCHHAHGMVNVVGQKGDWCKLSDGNYIMARYLTPARSGERIRKLR